jgi:polyisoprenyl-teichoic acid--peptidoglycan teichoic acid transferase
MQQRKAAKLKFFKRKGFLWTLITIGVVLLSIVGYYGFSVFRFLHAIHTPQDGSVAQAAPAWTGTDRVNILLLGVDNRNNDPHPRSDSMVVVSIDPVTKTARMFSVMRDTWYKIPGYGFEKINAAYSLGGPDLAMQTVSNFLQIPIHYYVKTDFQGFEKLVDAVGGVKIDVEKDMDYPDDGVYDILLHKGEQVLDGKHALMYVRFRHDAMGDFARTERQRKFLTALAEKLKTPGALVKLPSILETIRPYVDTNMQIDDMIKLGSLVADVNMSDMKSMQIPPTDAMVINDNMNGMSVLIPDVYKCRVAVHDLLGMTDVVEKPTDDQYPLVQTQPASASTTESLPESKKDDPPPQPKWPVSTQKSGSDSTNDSGENVAGKSGGSDSATNKSDGTTSQNGAGGSTPSSSSSTPKAQTPGQENGTTETPSGAKNTQPNSETSGEGTSSHQTQSKTTQQTTSK